MTRHRWHYINYILYDFRSHGLLLKSPRCASAGDVRGGKVRVVLPLEENDLRKFGNFHGILYYFFYTAHKKLKPILHLLLLQLFKVGRVSSRFHIFRFIFLACDKPADAFLQYPRPKKPIKSLVSQNLKTHIAEGRRRRINREFTLSKQCDKTIFFRRKKVSVDLTLLAIFFF